MTPGPLGVAAAIVLGVLLGAAACPRVIVRALPLASANGSAPDADARGLHSVDQTADIGNRHDGAPTHPMSGPHHSDTSHDGTACLGLVRVGAPGGVVSEPAPAQALLDEACVSRPATPIPRALLAS